MEYSSFCSAKWLQVSVKLQNGTTHSCHHPPVHKIPLPELFKNLSAFHNTSYKKQQRQKMLTHQRPSECEYCWSMEDKGLKSDRFKKAQEDWSQKYLDRIDKEDAHQDIIPSYLEVSFSHQCQLACAYCNLETSSSIYEESLKHGPYLYEDSIAISKRKKRLPDQSAVYSDKFWPYFKSILSDLDELRVTGGEPLLDQNTFKLIEYLEQNPMPKLKFSINSNLSLPTTMIEKLSDRLSQLVQSKHIKSFCFFTSLDNDGKQAEFIRFGLKTSLFWKNIDHLLKRDEFDIVIMCTFGVYSVEGFEKLLEQVASRNPSRLKLSISRLTYPSYLSIDVLAASQLDQILKLRGVAKELNLDRHVIETLDQFSTKLKGQPNQPLLMMNLSLFLREYERRKKVKLNEVFPQISHELKSYTARDKPMLFLYAKVRILIIKKIKFLFPQWSQSFIA